MKLVFLSLLTLSFAAQIPQIRGILGQRQDELELSSYDEACNIGYCSVMGA